MLHDHVCLATNTQVTRCDDSCSVCCNGASCCMRFLWYCRTGARRCQASSRCYKGWSVLLQGGRPTIAATRDTATTASRDPRRCCKSGRDATRQDTATTASRGPRRCKDWLAPPVLQVRMGRCKAGAAVAKPQLFLRG